MFAVLLWLLACGTAAFAQDMPGPITLDSRASVVSLDGRSVYWVDPTGQATVEQIGQWMSGLWPGAEVATEDSHAAA